MYQREEELDERDAQRASQDSAKTPPRHLVTGKTTSSTKSSDQDVLDSQQSVFKRSAGATQDGVVEEVVGETQPTEIPADDDGKASSAASSSVELIWAPSQNLGWCKCGDSLGAMEGSQCVKCLGRNVKTEPASQGQAPKTDSAEDEVPHERAQVTDIHIDVFRQKLKLLSEKSMCDVQVYLDMCGHPAVASDEADTGLVMYGSLTEQHKEHLHTLVDRLFAQDLPNQG